MEEKRKEKSPERLILFRLTPVDWIYMTGGQSFVDMAVTRFILPYTLGAGAGPGKQDKQLSGKTVAAIIKALSSHPYFCLSFFFKGMLSFYRLFAK